MKPLQMQGFHLRKNGCIWNCRRNHFIKNLDKLLALYIDEC